MFKRSFQTQFYIMVHQIGFQLGFLIVLLCGLLNTACWLISNYGGAREAMVDESYAFLLTELSPLGSVFFVGSLFIVLFPYCFSGIKNRVLQTDLLFIVRGDTRSYYVAGAAVSFCGTTGMFFLPLLIELCINHFCFNNMGLTSDGMNTIYGTAGGGGLMGTTIDTSLVINPGFALIPIRFFLSHPFIYNMLYAMLYAVFMGVAAVLAYGFSLFLKKRIYLFFSLYFIYRMMVWVGSALHRQPMISFDVFQYFTVTNVMNLSYSYICSVTLGMLLFAGGLIARKIQLDQGL